MRANDRFGFMQEGGVLALSLLHGAEIALHGSSVTIFIRGEELADGTLTLGDTGPRIVLDHVGTSWLEGELGAEAAGERQLSNSWATMTLVRAVPNDPRSHLCANVQSESLDPVRLFTRRAACEPHESELASDGRTISDPSASR